MGVEVKGPGSTLVTILLKRLPVGGISGGLVLNQSPSYTFPAAEFGYTTPPTLNLNMINFGGNDTGTLNYTLSDTTAFFLSSGATTASLAQDADRDFSV